MKSGRRKILAGLLALSLMLTSLPGTVVLAEDSTVDYSEGFTVWFNTDGSTTGIQAGQVGTYPVYAGENMAGKTNKITVNGTDYYSVQGTNNPKTDGANPDGKIPTTGAYLKVVAPSDGTITVYGFPAAGKPFYATKGDTAAITDSNAFANYSYTVTAAAGEEWYFYAQSSKAQFVGVEFALPKASVTIPVSFSGADLGDATVSVTNQTTGDVVTLTSASTEVTLTEGYKYDVATDSASLTLDTAEIDLTGDIPESIVITVAEAAKHMVSGSFKGLPEGARVSSLSFTDENGAETVAVIDGTGYTVELKNGNYSATATTDAEGFSVYDNVAVEGTEGETITDDVWFYGASASYSTDYVSEITAGQSGDYKTITEAIAAAKAMTRGSSDYVTIKLLDEEYTEQVIVDAANIRLVAADGVTPTVSWYYGIGYKYYSIDSTGYYNEKSANDKYEMNYAQRWGCTVRVKADGFYAEGIDFVNTFNIKVVDEELGDSKVGNAAEYGQSISGSLQERVAGLDVANGTNVERAAAVALDAANAEFYKCSFTSSQDTLYTGSSVAYFNACKITGQTDYIFGNTGCKAIFDNCQLQWLGYTAGSKAGYVTATRGDYLFRGCTITNNDAEGYTVTTGYFGRPWGTTPSVTFLGTTIEKNAICDEGWYSMSGVTPDQVTFREYGNTCDGENFYTTYSKDASSSFRLTTADATKAADPANDSTYLGTFTPVNGISKAFDISGLSSWASDSATDDSSDDSSEETTTSVYTLETSSLTAFAAGAKADGDMEKAGTDNYFTLIYSAKSKVDSSSKTWDDGYTSSQRVNFGGLASIEKNAIKFTTTGDNASVKVWWAEGGDDNRQMAILNNDGTTAAVTSETLAKNATCVSTLSLSGAGTYYLGGATNNNYIFKVEVTETRGEVVEETRTDWSKVAAPVITSATQDGFNVNVAVTMTVGKKGADLVKVTMTDSEGKETTKNSMKDGDAQSVTFTPSASGTYTFSAVAVRDDEETTIAAEKTLSFDFVLPLTAPAVNSVTNKGNGSVEVTWDAATEAKYYVVTVDGVDTLTTEDTTATITGLTVGQKYTIGIRAARSAEDMTEIGTTADVNVKAEAERTWSFTTYGASTDSSHNGYTGSVNDGSVTVYSTNGKGKIVPASCQDGLSFYYTTIDADAENFTLEADITVDAWTLSNGQEGFGLMVADTIGANGDTSVVWNNSLQNIVSKMSYYWDGSEVTTDTTASQITMKLGVGVNSRLGITGDDVDYYKENATFLYSDGSTNSVPEGFSATQYTLETSCASSGAGTYNIVGNYTTEPTGTVANPTTTFHLKIQRNNTGYILTYSDLEGNVIGSKKIYDLDRDALTQIDKDNIYVGFIASRNAKMTATNISFTTIAPADDEAAEEREIEYIEPVYTIESATTANSSAYNLVYYGNADGTITINDSKGNTIVDNEKVTAGVKSTFATTLSLGDNKYTITVTPDSDYQPAKYTKLSSYDAVTFTHTVSYKYFNGTNIYVTADGSSSGTGSKTKPVDIYTAVKYVAAGQKIILAGGTYNLTSTISIARGIDGTADKMIYMVAEDESNRPVFNFGGNCMGMSIAGNYWYFKGFDVTNSADATKGINLSGSYNTLDSIRAYKNGNTGIQISRLYGSDSNDQWPAYNTIKNCTSFLNADKGYEDADGFAAKLTVGEGNVFDGCISAYNADDGWDLYAKSETGKIGKVTIKNSVAFMNGYVIDESGNLINAGNGNGFKMGGESLSGYHTLINSIAFANKAKGFDSNSCPDIQVYNSISFDNEGYNVAFYTNMAKNTDYLASGVISFKLSNDVAEQIKPLGTQDTSKIYGSTNYFTYGKNNSYNTVGEGETATYVSTDWFTSVETASVTAQAVKEMLDGTFGLVTNESTVGVERNSDGTVTTNGYLTLTEKAPEADGTSAYAGLYATTAQSDSASVTVDLSGKYSSKIVAKKSVAETIAEAVSSAASTITSTVKSVISKVVSTIKNAIAKKSGSTVKSTKKSESTAASESSSEAVSVESASEVTEEKATTESAREVTTETSSETVAADGTSISDENVPTSGYASFPAAPIAGGVIAGIILILGGAVLLKKRSK